MRSGGGNDIGGSCDVCSHIMRETDHVESIFYKRNFARHGHLTHLKASQKPKLTWSIYLMEDLGYGKQYVGSTTDVCGRWAAVKSACIKQNSKTTGLYKHFQERCSSDTTEQLLEEAGRIVGPQCRCSQSKWLKRIEDKWIMRMETFFGNSGLNKNVRGNFKL
jgi:predicted GIY-YIG superfamily endonuclease